MSDLKAAAASYLKAIEINPLDYRAFFSLAQVYNQDVNPSIAHYYFMRAAALQRKLPKIWLALGDHLLGRERKEEAVKAFKHGVRCDPELHEHEARVCLLRVICEEKERENALRWVRAAALNRDEDVFSGEGFEVMQQTFKWLEEQGEWNQGLSLCNALLQYEEPAIIGVAKQWQEVFEEKREEMDLSVSMDCSD